MSASTLSTHHGRPTAKQRVEESWAIWHDEDTARHNRMMQALRRIESAAPVVSDVPADPFKWREAEHNFKNDLRREECACCKGTGEIWVYIDFPPDPCPSCQVAFLRGDAQDVSIF